MKVTIECNDSRFVELLGRIEAMDVLLSQANQGKKEFTEFLQTMRSVQDDLEAAHGHLVGAVDLF